MNYALITGGSRGIGRAISIELSKMGFAVIINFISNEAAAHETKQIIENQGGNAELLKFDVTDKIAVDKNIETWITNHPEDTISILVNNAGIRQDALMIFMQDEQWENVINTNLNSFFYVTRRILKSMITKRFGRIINIVSLSGIKGLPGQTNYSTAKAGIIGATKALAQEVASRKITVNAVAPGFIISDMTKDLDENSLKAMIPVGRFGKPEEVATVVGFLATEGASYITGEVISVNGGLYT
ncbi:MAG: 3-oxoacyl-ACP reductase FabG [Bacteroidales bacterium]|jgi:3-oxoacyl-[acyl-carrier protein] reductase|nr:3-oxoacyl-ACP reductase FabG [Bacteroidales bacterium]